MRLFDAVTARDLSVPDSVSKLEAKLKKEWTKNDRELKKTTSTTAKAASSTKGSAGSADAKKATVATMKKAPTKRKADDDVPVASSSTSKAQKTAKKAKAAATAKAAAKTEADAPKPPKKQTARRGGHSQGPARGANSAASQPREQPAMPKQTARRSSAFMARGRIPFPGSLDVRSNDNDSDGMNKVEDESDNYDSYDSYDSDNDNSSINLAPLGLLNGSYDVSSEDVESQWGFGSNFSLELKLEGSALWGSFDLGIVEGAMYFDERPWKSSYDAIPFTWHGREHEGPIFYGNNNTGWMKFYGDGRVEGEIDFQSITFQGDRLQGQGTRGTLSINSLQNEWRGYSESQYEHERTSRWG